ADVPPAEPRQPPAPEAATAPVRAEPSTPPRATAAPAPGLDASTWPDFVAALELRGPVRELAASSAFVAHGDGVLRLSLPESDEHLRAPFLVQQLADALGDRWGAPPQIRFEAAPAGSV